MTDNRTAKSANDIIVEKVELISSNGKVENISYFYDIISIYESMYTPVMTGYIQITDARNLYSTLALNGSEYIRITFRKPGEEFRYSRIFRIFSSKNRQPHEKNLSQVYTLHFCSEELIFSNQLIISRSMKHDTATNDIIAILKNDLRVNSNKLKSENFENSLGTTEFVFTSAKPFEIIDVLMRYAYGFTGSPFLFYENNQGFNFKSLETILNQPVITTLNYSTAKIANESKDSPHLNYNEISKFIFESSFDLLNTTKKAAFSGSLFTLDLIRQKYTMQMHSLAQPGIGESLMDKKLPIAGARNRNGRTVFEEYDTKIKYTLTNLNQTDIPYALDRGVRVTNTNVEKVLMQREMHLALLNNTVVKCIVPGNPNFTIGNLVNFNLPGFMQEQEKERFIDPYHSGKYLITGVRHLITRAEGFETALELSKNSSAASYTVSTDSEYSKAVAS